HLLMTPLHRALPLPEVQHLPVSVCEYLDLDVAGALEILLDVDAVVTEGLTRLALCALECALHLRRVAHDAHAFAAAAGRCLEQHRVTECPRGVLRRRCVRERFRRAG